MDIQYFVPGLFEDEVRKVFSSSFDSCEIKEYIQYGNFAFLSKISFIGWVGHVKYYYDFKLFDLMEWHKDGVLTKVLESKKEFLLNTKR